MRADAPGDPAAPIGRLTDGPVPGSSPPGTSLPGGSRAGGSRAGGSRAGGSRVYPVGMRMQGRLAVVVGGGSAAARRVTGLLAAGADVLVVAPALSPWLEGKASSGQLTARKRCYAGGDLDGAWLAYACTGQPQVDAAVVAEAERRRIWCGSDEDAGAAASLARGQAGAAPPRRMLVLGGARSGKSVTAERLLADHDQVDYIATGPVPGPGDTEWGARVLVHQQRRPADWRTVETLDVERELAGPGAAGAAAVLVDCLSTWLAAVMDDCGIWAELPDADRALQQRVAGVVAAWRSTGRFVVAVSSEVGSGVVPGTVSGRRFRDELGSLNARIAAECDEVWLCTAGIPRRLR